MKKIIPLIFFILILVQVGNAIKLSPAGTGIEFKPNLEQTIAFHTDIGSNIDVSLSGDLAKYLEVVENTIETDGNFKVKLKLPETLETPGDNVIFVGVSQLAGEGMVGAVASVRGAIVIKVPFPGLYGTFSFFVEDLNVNETRNFYIDAKNKGKIKFKASSEIEIFNDKNISVDKIYSEEKLIEPTASTTINALFNSTNHNSGQFNAIATISYGDKQRVIEAPFKIGSKHLKLIEYTNLFEPNKINQFKIIVESDWNNPINNVFANVNIYDGTKLLSTFRTPNKKVPAWGREELIAFWDATEVGEGTYNLEFTINYEDVSDIYKGAIIVEKQKLNIPFYKKINLTTTLIIVGVILLILNLIIMRKKGTDRSKKKSKKK
tara:strand:+ start:206 stop:1339 length:1134 start_codon:yes stop_codon:yes gene_type:complete